MMKRVAIVGGSGFIGTHTARELTDHGHDVTVVDLVAPCDKNLRFVQADVSVYEQALEALAGNYDVVYMLAAISDSSENLSKPVTAVSTNIQALTNVLYVMKMLNIPKIVFSSTVWVYSVCEQTEVNEDTPLPITSSNHIYTTCKLTCESLIRNFQNISNIKYTIFRYGIAYGPGCHPDTVVSKFLTNAINNQPLVITGGGNIYRNFLYVKDHARGNRMALNSSTDNQTINLEGPEQITIQQVADTVSRMHGDVDIIKCDERVGDYKGKIVSSAKAYNLMGWKPTVMFTQGMSEMYDHMT